MRTRRSLPPNGKHVLITGASTGLGRETALCLAERGFHVIAGVRRKGDAERLVADCATGRLDSVLIDVTDEDQVNSAVTQIAEKVGEQGLWGLVNNAGICVSAPLECISTDVFRRQLDVSVIGQLTVIRAMLPLLRKGTPGRMVNLTSGIGKVAVPYLGAYSAAEFAKEGMSDVLRRELAPLGVAVSVVSPGAIMTPIWGKVTEEGEHVMASAPEPVANLYHATFRRFLQANAQRARDSRTTPGDVASAVHSALTAARPRTRYRVGKDVRRVSLLARLLPDTAIDVMLRQIVTPTSDKKHGRLRV